MSDQTSTAILPTGTTVTYDLQYRITGPLYPKGAPTRSRTLTLVRGGTETTVRTEEDALIALRDFISRPWVNASVEVVRLTKVTKQVTYEDKTDLAREYGRTERCICTRKWEERCPDHGTAIWRQSPVENGS